MKNSIMYIAYGIVAVMTAAIPASLQSGRSIDNTVIAEKESICQDYMEDYLEEQSVIPETYVDYTVVETETEVHCTDVLSAYVTQEYMQFSDYEKDLLLKIAYCEAGNQGIEGQALVMRVVLNRVESEYFPNTIEEVIYQEGQFASIYSNTWNESTYSADTYAAYDMICSYWNNSNGALYFCTSASNQWHINNLTYLYKYKDHEFYK